MTRLWVVLTLTALGIYSCRGTDAQPEGGAAEQLQPQTAPLGSTAGSASAGSSSKEAGPQLTLSVGVPVTKNTAPSAANVVKLPVEDANKYPVDGSQPVPQINGKAQTSVSANLLWGSICFSSSHWGTASAAWNQVSEAASRTAGLHACGWSDCICSSYNAFTCQVLIEGPKYAMYYRAAIGSAYLTSFKKDLDNLQSASLLNYLSRFGKGGKIIMTECPQVATTRYPY